MQTLLFNTPFFSGSFDEALAEISKALEGKTLFVVFTPNTEHLMLAERNTEFREALKKSNLNVPDSIGIVWAGKMLDLSPFPKQRIAGRQLVDALFPILEHKKKSLFLLGGGEGVAEKTSSMLHKKYPNLRVGMSSGARDITHEKDTERTEVLASITAFKPDVLLVAYGAPFQELWTLKNKDELRKSGVKVVIVVGGALDILSGRLSRVPDMIASLGLEWLWRLIQEPWRVRRQRALPLFAMKVMKEKFRKK